MTNTIGSLTSLSTGAAGTQELRKPQQVAAFELADGKASGVLAGSADNGRTMEKFEAVLLRKMIDSILPDGKAGVFGGGPAGPVWRSMLADVLSDGLARTNTLGLQDVLAKGQARAERGNVSE